MTTQPPSLSAQAVLDAANAAYDKAATVAEGTAAARNALALAQPEPEGLTDEELLELMPQQFRDDLATVSRLASYGTPVEPGIYRVSLNTGSLNFARAVEAAALARYSHPIPQPPADGEVAELVERLTLISDGMSAMNHELDSWFVARAAELLLGTELRELAKTQLTGKSDSLEFPDRFFYDGDKLRTSNDRFSH